MYSDTFFDYKTIAQNTMFIAIILAIFSTSYISRLALTLLLKVMEVFLIMVEKLFTYIAVNEHIRKSDNLKYYSIKILDEDTNKMSIMFFRDSNLYNKIKDLKKYAQIFLKCELNQKDENSFTLTPKEIVIE